MLKRLICHYDDGRITDEILSINDGETLKIYPKRDNIKISISSVFKYEVEYPYHPMIYTSSRDGKKYIMPLGIEVHQDTQNSDIKWIRPVGEVQKKFKQEQKKTVNTWSFESSSEPGNFYTVMLTGNGDLKCNCPGVWRVKDKSKGCKHMKSVESSLAT